MADWYMEKDGVSCKVEGPVAIFKIDIPETKNGATWRAKAAQTECYEYVANDPDVRVIVITGGGDYFLTGGRVDAKDPEDRRLYAEYIARLEEARNRVNLPVIAAVNGDCLKGGMGSLLDADLAIAKRTAKFAFPEMRMGGVPMKVMARCMALPKKLALEAYYSSMEIDAETMLRFGFLNAVTDEEDFWPTVETYIPMLIDQPRKLIQMTHVAYFAMEKILDPQERLNFSQNMLEKDVLPQMAHEKQEYNV